MARQQYVLLLFISERKHYITDIASPRKRWIYGNINFVCRIQGRLANMRLFKGYVSVGLSVCRSVREGS